MRQGTEGVLDERRSSDLRSSKLDTNRLRLFTVREWLMLPFGKKILRLNKKIKK